MLNCPLLRSDLLISRQNRWRHRTLLKYAGPPRRPGGVKSGDWWHAITTRDVRRRYHEGLKKNYKAPDYGCIAEAHNNAFRGKILPGEFAPVPKREYTQIAAIIKRKWKDDKYIRENAAYQAKKARALLKKLDRNDEEKAKQTTEANFTSTIDELWACEMSKQKLMVSDTESDEDEGKGKDADKDREAVVPAEFDYESEDINKDDQDKQE